MIFLLSYYSNYFSLSFIYFKKEPFNYYYKASLSLLVITSLFSLPFIIIYSVFTKKTMATAIFFMLPAYFIGLFILLTALAGDIDTVVEALNVVVEATKKDSTI